MFVNEIMPKLCPKFFCEICDYGTSKKSSYGNHIVSSKHKKSMVVNEIMPKLCPKYTCEKCNKIYKDNSGLWRHNKKCINETKNNTSKKDDVNSNLLYNKLVDEDVDDSDSISVTNSEENNTDLEPSSKDIIQMMKMQMIENQEIRSLIIELLKKETISTINNNNNNNNNTINNNCNNKSFNLNVFLNEQCKDALNIDEFVDSIKMNLSDLEEFANVGYADGVSNIFSKGIKELGVHLRPIHCSDTKRETLYIKNNDEWVKETDDKPLIIKAIKKVAFKNIKQINEWVKENPSCKDPRTKKYDKYNKIVMNAMSGVTEQEQQDNIEKILKNVTKSVAIDKYALK